MIFPFEHVHGNSGRFNKLSSTIVRLYQGPNNPLQFVTSIFFIKSFHGILDLPVRISAMRLKDRVEQEFQEGIIEVERTGHCAMYEWKLTWTSHGGNHPEMKVNATGLRGVQVSAEVRTIEDGGLFLDPIPGEFLRMPATQPEVSGLH